MDELETKKIILSACKANLLESIHILEDEMKMLQESASNGTEVGMSDHLESNDEEMMNDRKDRERRLEALYDDLRKLDEVDTTEKHVKIGFGSVITTEERSFFVAIARSFQATEKPYIGLSTAAPIFSAMEGKMKDEGYSFNGQSGKIKDLF